jgi:bifunctional non-homologous end joining protein LigD
MAAKKPPRTAGTDPLATYRAKRAAGSTPEPIGSVSPAAGRRSVFVCHEHVATRHHWDLRLEVDGVLLSWAVPKEPSMDPEDKRLAVKVESHPLEYLGFEAVIPAGNYGAGPMIVWDRGLFVPTIDAASGLRDGEIKFELWGYKLRGAFTLVHTGKHRRGRGSGRGSDDWLLIKKRDAWAEAFLAAGEPLPATSVLSGLTVEELRDGSARAAALRRDVADLGLPSRVIGAADWKPMLCHTADRPFSAEGWLFELKYDGYRLGGFGGAGQAELRYRSGIGATDRFPEIAAAVRALPCPGLALDGEVVVLDAEGRPTFQLLQQRTQLARASDIQRASGVLPATYFVFDLLGLDGTDLRGLPLIERKALLRRLLPAVGPVRYADHVETLGAELLAQVIARGLEGVVAKKADAPYRGIRSRDWLKLKRDLEGDFAICGFSPPKGGRTGLGALHLCVRDGVTWAYAGKVGSGLDERELIALRAALDASPPWTPPFAPPDGSRQSRWVEPHLACQVRYREWPEGHAVRLPVFVRLRPDKPAIECTPPPRRTGAHGDAPEASPEVVVDGAAPRELRLSNLKKVFWPDQGYTKGDLIAYYREIAPWILPYLADRPTVLTRFPDGIAGKHFYQKDIPDWVPPWLRTIALWSEGSGREIHYVLVDDADGLAYVANLGSIPIHVWASRTADLGRPDWSIIDLDPKGAPREHVVPLALAVHELCESIALPNYVKTSGQTGLHVLIPLGGQLTFDQARQLAYLLGMVVEGRHPDMATTLRNPAARGGRVYLDWGQNAHGQLLVAPFSVRPVPGATVSMPLTWDEVTPALDVGAFTIRTALARMERRGADPVRPVLTERPDLMSALEKLTALVGDGAASG